MPVLTGKIGISSPKESAWWSDPPIPAANALSRADGLGLRRHAIEKKSPRKGTKTLAQSVVSPFLGIIEKKSPRKGTKTIVARHTSELFANWKKVPKKGDENYYYCFPWCSSFRIEKKSPRKGTKTWMETLLRWNGTRPLKKSPQERGRKLRYTCLYR